MHPSLEFLLVCFVAAAGSFLLTPLARVVAVRWGAVARPRDRDVHAVAIPRLGGVALLGGFCLAMLLASRLPTLTESFHDGPDIVWVVVAGVMICALGVLDDKIELDSITKLAGQVVCIGLMVTKGGVQVAAIYWPFSHGGTVVSLGGDLGVPVTIVLSLVTINALNFIDGLDGLAAGVAAVSAGAFFLFSYHLAAENFYSVTAPSLLLAAALAGLCLGFLPHNVFPARIFMGDSGSMLIGLILSAAATTATTSVDPQAIGRLSGTLSLSAPVLIIFVVLAIPLADLVLAVIRRLGRGRSPFAPDKKHLHHRLLAMGHSHRRSVLLLYFWSALLAFGGVLSAIVQRVTVVVPVIAAGAVVGVVLVVVPRWTRPGRPVPPPPSPSGSGPAGPAPAAAPAVAPGAGRPRP